MKKYKLLKDLPLAKAGTIVKILPMFNNKEYYGIRKYNEEYSYFSLGYIKDDILNEWLEEIPEKPKSVWELKEIDNYFYYIGKYGEIREANMGTEEMSEYGNIFLTEEEAEKELERRKAIQKIKKYCWENGIETSFKEGEFNHGIYFDYTYKKLQLTVSKNKYESSIGFFSYEDIFKILEKFEEELKIILDV